MKIIFISATCVIIFYTLALAQFPVVEWSFDLSAPSFGSAASDDIDGDGLPEIVFGTYFNDERIVALNGDDGSILWSYDTGACNDASPVIYDVDMDGELEVVIPASSTCMVYCFDGATGAIEWSVSTGLPNCIDSPPAVADVDNDGRPEIVLGTFYGKVFCFNGENGSICWQVNLGNNSYIQSDPAIFDCNGDGQLDVIVAQWAGDERIYALRGDNGATLWFSDLPEDYMYHGCSFADIDEDGLPEIAIGSYDGDLYVLNAENGSLVWEYQGALYIGAPTSVADLNNDGHPEIAFVSYNTMKVYSHTGSQLWTYPAGGNIFRGAAIADVNGDNWLDLVFGADDGIVRALRGNNGAVIWTINLQQLYGHTFEIDHAPIIGDFNGDDSLDVFIIGGYGTSSTPTNNHGRAYMLTAGVGDGPGWKMFRHDERHSGVFSLPQSTASITLTPLNPPIIIQPGGGNFSYNVSLQNTGQASAVFDVWCDVILPTGSPYGPVLGPVGVMMSPGQSIMRTRIQQVPGNAPAGNYYYRAFIGDYPLSTADGDSFMFTKNGLSDRGISEWGNWEIGEYELSSPIPAGISLVEAYPNPFNQSVKLRFELNTSDEVEIGVFSVDGRKVQDLGTRYCQAGGNDLVWNAEGMTNGVYFVRIETGGYCSIKKVILLK